MHGGSNESYKEDDGLGSPLSSLIRIYFRIHPSMSSNTNITFRQQVDQWFARNKQYQYSVTYTEKGPQNARLYQCTYLLNLTTDVMGDWKRNKPDAKESAAKEVMKILNNPWNLVRLSSAPSWFRLTGRCLRVNIELVTLESNHFPTSNLISSYKSLYNSCLLPVFTQPFLHSPVPPPVEWILSTMELPLRIISAILFLFIQVTVFSS